MAWINNQQDWPDVYGLGPDADLRRVRHQLVLPARPAGRQGVRRRATRRRIPGMAIQVPGNVYYNGYMATRELLRCRRGAGTTNNIAVIKKLEGRKMSARDRMQDLRRVDRTRHAPVPADDLHGDVQRPADGEGRHLQDPDAVPTEGRRWTRTRRRRASSRRTRRRRRTRCDVARAARRAPAAPVRAAPCAALDALLNLVPHLVNGLALGLLFALIALGFMLIVGVMETINLAHGSFFALGMYVALSLIAPSCRRAPASRSTWYRALPLGVALRDRARCSRRSSSASFGMLLELALRRTYGTDPLYGLLLTFGAALVIEEADPRGVGLDREAAAAARGDLRRVPRWATSSTRSTGCSRAAFAIVAIGAAVAVPREDAVRRDHQGRRARQRDGARARHQPRRGCGCFVFALGVALAALAGVVMAPIWGMRPHVGVDAVVPAFLIIVLGGVGSFWGAVRRRAAGRARRRARPARTRPSGRCCRCTCCSSPS